MNASQTRAVTLVENFNRHTDTGDIVEFAVDDLTVKVWRDELGRTRVDAGGRSAAFDSALAAENALRFKLGLPERTTRRTGAAAEYYAQAVEQTVQRTGAELLRNMRDLAEHLQREAQRLEDALNAEQVVRGTVNSLGVCQTRATEVDRLCAVLTEQVEARTMVRTMVKGK